MFSGLAIDSSLYPGPEAYPAQSSNVSSYLGRPDQTKSPAPGTPLGGANVVNVVIAKNFNFVEEDVQVQALQVRKMYGDIEGGPR